jgi:endonuclease-8
MEGPTLLILRERAEKFTGQKISVAWGSQKIDMERLAGQRVNSLQHWGKHFLIVLDDCTIRIHYLMFGNYYIDSRHPEKTPKLALELPNGEWNNYNCAAKILEGTDVETWYDWSGDVMNEAWNPEKAKQKLKTAPQTLACDALMDQSIFAGVGNVIKNEVLFRIKVHPEAPVGALPAKKLAALIEQARTYSFDFYRWEQEGVRRKKYCVHRRARCPDCSTRIEKKFTGLTPRSSFWCANCQKK